MAKPDPKLQLLKDAFGILKAAANHTPPPPQPPQLHDDNPEIRSFLDFVLQKMKTYSRHTNNLVQQEICQIIFRADQGGFEHPQRVGYFPPSSHFSGYSNTSLHASTITSAPVGYFTTPQQNQFGSISRDNSFQYSTDSTFLSHSESLPSPSTSQSREFTRHTPSTSKST